MTISFQWDRHFLLLSQLLAPLIPSSWFKLLQTTSYEKMIQLGDIYDPKQTTL